MENIKNEENSKGNLRLSNDKQEEAGESILSAKEYQKSRLLNEALNKMPAFEISHCLTQFVFIAKEYFFNQDIEPKERKQQLKALQIASELFMDIASLEKKVKLKKK
jgi:hypothetical protein